MARRKHTLEQAIKKLRGELLDREIVDTPRGAQVLTPQHRQSRNRLWPHGSPGNRPSAPAAILPA